MVLSPINLIERDERGLAIVSGSSVKVRDIGIDAERWGLSAAEIQENYPRLSLAEIYAALSYFYDHQAEITAQVTADEEEVQQLRAANPNPLRRQNFEERLKNRDRDAQ